MKPPITFSKTISKKKWYKDDFLIASEIVKNLVGLDISWDDIKKLYDLHNENYHEQQNQAAIGIESD